MRNPIWCVVVAAAIVLTMIPAMAQPTADNRHDVKNVIMMVPDGMGLADVTAARILLNCGNTPGLPPVFCPEGPAGPPLYFETLEHIGYQRTYSETNTITDSAAAASAWSCGEKFVNNELCKHADGRVHNPTLLEVAKSKGMATGLVATQTITHATPAAFAAHTTNRNCETEIARQYIEETKPDVLLGGGQSKFQTNTPDACGTSGDYITAAQGAGYTYADTKDAMDAAADSSNQVLGLFAPTNLTPEYLGTRPATEPRLPDMTTAALKILQRSNAGFFLMVEGSLVDSGNHAENLDYQYGEIKAFNEAVKAVLDWINTSPARREHTLLIVLADHETGGFAVKGVGEKGGEIPGAGLGPFQAGWTFTISASDTEAHHTGGDTMIWSQGPGSEALGRAIDNTFVYQLVRFMLKR